MQDLMSNQGDRAAKSMSADTRDTSARVVLQGARIAHRRGQCSERKCAGNGMLEPWGTISEILGTKKG